MSVAFHLNEYLINNNLSESLHSSYKSGHSTHNSLGSREKLYYDVN